MNYYRCYFLLLSLTELILVQVMPGDCILWIQQFNYVIAWYLVDSRNEISRMHECIFLKKDHAVETREATVIKYSIFADI